MESQEKSVAGSGLYAFWKYDLYPYLLGGAVSHMDYDRVYVESYQGWFKPIFLLQAESGKQILDGLKQLDREYAAAKKDLHDDFLEKRRRLLAQVL